MTANFIKSFALLKTMLSNYCANEGENGKVSENTYNRFVLSCHEIIVHVDVSGYVCGNRKSTKPESYKVYRAVFKSALFALQQQPTDV